ncbi:MAG: sugar phosphate isomerase/epimerase [Sedimentisphaerales bacterium]|nr:sugar phosphate isomerase/epimerase [Sedimentisphaerales bacterium]
MIKDNSGLMDSPTRRDFLAGLAGAGALLSMPLAGGNVQAAAAERRRMKICIFSKHLQWLDYKDMARTAAELGFDGVDLTVRPRGHVLPERAKDDLPRAVEAVKNAGLTVPMMTTRITDPRDRHTIPILETAAKLGIRHYRIGSIIYKKDKSIPAQLAELKPMLRDLAALNKEYNLHGAFQNHSGSNYIGASIWDIWELIKELDPKWMGCQFDVRHATVEGGLVWPTKFRLIADRVVTIIAKDFLWVKTNKGWKIKNCPLGEGMVDFPRYFKMVKQAGIPGPLSVHYEYDLGGANRGRQTLSTPKENVTKAIRRDLTTLKSWLREADL